jgi:hypothetical protein
MERFPSELADILTPRGRAVLEGRDALCGVLTREPFAVADDLLDPDFSRRAPDILARAFDGVLVRQDCKLPSNRSNERLSKVGRVHTTTDEPNGPIAQRAADCGLLALLRSSSYLAFCAALSGRDLDGPMTLQAFCSQAGDYVGPHTDHYPDNEAVRDGYTDVHFTFCTEGVHRQLLVYELEGHFSKVVPVTVAGAVTAYRLPLWHYTTPLEAEPAARRWLVAGSFADRRLQK